MSFALSAGVITQSGTDTSLAGLSGIAGVSVIGTVGKQTYVLSAVKLVVSGSLTISPQTEELDFLESVTGVAMSVSGSAAVLTLGAATLGTPGNRTVVIPPSVRAINVRRIGSNFSDVQILVTAGGALVQYFGDITTRGSITIDSTAAATCVFNACVYLGNTSSQPGRFYLRRQVAFGVYARIFNSGIEQSGAPPVSNVTIVNGQFFSVHGPGGTLTSPYVLTNVNIVGGGDIYPYGAAMWELVDFQGAGNVAKNGGGVPAGTRIAVRTKASVTIKPRMGGSPIVGAKLFSRDTDNGARETVVTPPSDTFDFRPDNVYLATTTSSGASITFIVQNWTCDTSGVKRSDWRTLTYGENTFLVHVWSYLSKYTSATVDLTAAGYKEVVIFAEADANVSATAAAVAAYSDITTLDMLYDAAKAWRCADANIEYPTVAAQPVSALGAGVSLGALSIHLDSGATSAFAIDKALGKITIRCANLAAGSKFTSLFTTGSVTRAVGSAITVPYSDATGTYTAITVAGVISGSRVQVFNLSTGVELLNIETSSAADIRIPVRFTGVQSVRVRVGYAVGTTAKLPDTQVVPITALGATVSVIQTDDPVYNALAIDGGTATEFTPAFPDLQISTATGTTTVQRLYAWAAWSQTSALGIAMMFGAVKASDTSNFLIDVAAVNAHLKNIHATPLLLTGGNIVRSDGTTVIAASSNAMQLDPGKAYVASVPGLAAAVRTELALELARIDTPISTRASTGDVFAA